MLSTGALVLGRYEVTEYLGGGGFATAYLAKDRAESDKFVAFKLSTATMGSIIPEDKDILERFRREAEILKKIDSTHVVRYITDGIHEDALVIVMEFAGDSLNKLMSKLPDGSLTPFDEPKATSIVAQSLIGLDDAYSVSCTAHRDIDLSNLFLTGSGVVKVGDFGIARLKGLPSLTGGKIMGKLRYMAPECFTTPKLVDWRADQYALGVCFTLLLSGKYPLGDPGDDIAGAMKSATEDEPAIPSVLLPGCCSDKISRVIMKMLSKSPADRFGSCHEIIDELGGAATAKRLCPKCLSLGEWDDKCCGGCGAKLGSDPALPKYDGAKSVPDAAPPVPIDFSKTKARVLVTRDDGKEYSVNLVKDVTPIGRDQLDPGNRFVSRKHAAVHRKSDGWYIKDDGSLNGTFVKAMLLSADELRRLENGDSIRFADTAAQFIVE